MTTEPLIALATSMLLATPIAAAGAELNVTIKNVRNAAGMVYVAVYDSDSTFLKIERARAQMRAPAAKGEVVFTIRDLPPGRYAVTAYHDENNNGKLDKNWMGVPTEGYGFSNDVKAGLGPPKFNQAAFAFDKDSEKAVSFSLKY